jgi:hypothetical protein
MTVIARSAALLYAHLVSSTSAVCLFESTPGEAVLLRSLLGRKVGGEITES